MIRVLNSGFYSTIQDTGRFGLRDYGVPTSGVMDSYSSQFANLILANEPNCAVMEMTMAGATLEFLKSSLVAFTGASMEAYLNGKQIHPNTPVVVNALDKLSFKTAKKGMRCYLAVKGGFTTPMFLGSRSFYTNITTSSTLKTGDVLTYDHFNNAIKEKFSSIKYDNSLFIQNELEVFPGPEYHLLTEEQKNQIWSRNFNVSKSNNRMAYILDEQIPNNLSPIITGPVMPGTVQLTPSGQLILLMRDCQTTGGYPRMLQLTERSINIVSQKRQGDSIKFRPKDEH